MENALLNPDEQESKPAPRPTVKVEPRNDGSLLVTLTAVVKATDFALTKAGKRVFASLGTPFGGEPLRGTKLNVRFSLTERSA